MSIIDCEYQIVHRDKLGKQYTESKKNNDKTCEEWIGYIKEWMKFGKGIRESFWDEKTNTLHVEFSEMTNQHFTEILFYPPTESVECTDQLKKFNSELNFLPKYFNGKKILEIMGSCAKRG